MSKKRKKKKQKKLIAKPTTRLVVGILLSLYIPFFVLCKYCIEYSVPWWSLAVVSGLLIVYCVYAYVKEKRDDKKSRKSLGDIEDNSYFTSSEWRERYLEYVQKKPFEAPSEKGMKADLTARYRRMQSLFVYFFGVFMFLLAAFLFYILKGDETLNEYPIFADIFAYLMSMIAVIIGIAVIRINIKILKADPVKNFFSMLQTVGEIDDIERSYEHGKIISYKRNGINIGIEYTVIYNQFDVYLIKNRDIKIVSRHVVRQKKYDTYEFVYKGDEFVHKLCILTKRQYYTTEYYVELNEFQVEMAISELSKFAEFHEKNGVSEEHILPISQKLYNKKEK